MPIRSSLADNTSRRLPWGARILLIGNYVIAARIFVWSAGNLATQLLYIHSSHTEEFANRSLTTAILLLLLCMSTRAIRDGKHYGRYAMLACITVICIIILNLHIPWLIVYLNPPVPELDWLDIELSAGESAILIPWLAANYWYFLASRARYRFAPT